jgi:hypothetical protein
MSRLELHPAPAEPVSDSGRDPELVVASARATAQALALVPAWALELELASASASGIRCSSDCRPYSLERSDYFRIRSRRKTDL